MVFIFSDARGCDIALVCRGVIFHQRVTDSACLMQLLGAPRPTASVRTSLWCQSLELLFKADAREAFALDLSPAWLIHMDKSSWRLPLSNERAGSQSQ